MEWVLKEYGATALAVVVVLFVFAILFMSNVQEGQIGILEVEKEAAHMKSVKYETYTDGNVLKEVLEVAPPSILANEQMLSEIKVGTAFCLSDCLLVKSGGEKDYCAGSEYDGTIQITAIKDADGTDCMEDYDMESGMLMMGKKGICTVSLTVADQSSRQTTAKLCFPVQ
jgi:hypothetical protein